MKALVLAAGRATRLGGDVAKPLVDVGGTTPLEHTLQWLVPSEPETIWINVHAHADSIRSRIGDRVAHVPVRYSPEPELLGTAGAWTNLASEWTSTSLVAYGDNLMRVDVEALRRAHEHGGRPLTVALFDPAVHANTGTGGGRARLRGDRIIDFEERRADGDEPLVATASPINAGVYLIEPELLERLPRGFLDFGNDVLPALAESGELTGHVLEREAYCLGVDTPTRLAQARAWLAQRAEAVQA